MLLFFSPTHQLITFPPFLTLTFDREKKTRSHANPVSHMLHPYSSEFVAGLTFLVLLAFAFVVAFRPSSTETSSHRGLEVLCYLASTACMCRFIAQGARCNWPPGVSFKGRVAVVVGASSGIGYAVAEELAEHDWTVILTGRDLTRLLRARERIFATLEEKKAIRKCSPLLQPVLPWLPRCVRTRIMRYKPPRIHGFNVIVLAAVDLTSETSIRSFVDTLWSVESTYSVGLLVNAAGVMHRHSRYCPSFTQWAGVETMIATNAVGSQLLTCLMLPLLESTAEKSGVSSRIVNVASSCHTWLFTSLSQLLPRFASSWSSSSQAMPPDPIEMLYGLECKAPTVQARPTTTTDTETRTSTRPAIRDAYQIKDFSLSNFVGYYGLSKLCVVWNTLLTARLVSHPRYRFSSSANAQGDAAASPSTPSLTGQYKVYIACCHPGVCVTGLYRELFPNWVLNKVLYYPSLVMGKTWHEGAQSALKIAVEDESMKLGGYYLCGGEYGPDSGVNCLSAHAQNPEAMKAYANYLAEKLGDDFGATKPIHVNPSA